MKLIGEEGLEVAVIPIGDNYTMGPDDALRAVKLLAPKTVIPIHFSTWDVIQQDAADWVARVGKETGAEGSAAQAGRNILVLVIQLPEGFEPSGNFYLYNGGRCP